MGQFLEDFVMKAKKAQVLTAQEDESFKCAVCLIALNEVEGQLQENITIDDIETKIDNDICNHLSGGLAKDCKDLVADLPAIAKDIDKTWDVNVACVDLDFCTKPVAHNESETIDMQTYVINLDLAPEERWTEICSNETYIAHWKDMVNWITGGLADGGKYVEELGEAIHSLMPEEYAAGNILHTRNLDFWAGMGFTDTLKSLALIADFQSGGVTKFKTTTFAGYSGALSGQVPGEFAVTIDTRFYPGGVMELLDEIVVAFTEKNATLVAFLSRDTLAQATSFEEAAPMLENGKLIADVYYIVSGNSAGEGLIISRNRTDSANNWQLDAASGRWYEVETNYDHWKPAPWFDNRRYWANLRMNDIGASRITLDAMFEGVMSQKPTLNLETTYTFLSVAANSTYKSYVRYCPWPCVQ